jgi:hypothetical protein
LLLILVIGAVNPVVRFLTQIVVCYYFNNAIKGVNLPARLVIVKGTEYYDGKTSRYVDYPLTDVLQMIGMFDLVF